MRKKTPNKKNPSRKKRVAEHITKGRLLESVVAMMHEYPGVKVEKNVELPARHSSKARTREIDVLLTGSVAEYTIQIPIACRNEATKVAVGDIGEFVDLLNDVGLPPQQAIFISVMGFESGAIERAKDLGIKTFLFEGLTKDRLAEAVEDAFQYFVYLLPQVTQISVRNEMPDGSLALVFSDEAQQYCGDVLDLVVSRWRQNEIAPTIGEFDLDLQVPDGWHQFFQNKPVKTLSIRVKLRIIGYIMTLAGQAKQFTLRDAEKKTREKFRLQVDFDPTKQSNNGYEVRTAITEAELSAMLERSTGVRIVHRMRLPKVLGGTCFHPISARVKDLMLTDVKTPSKEEFERLPPLRLEDVEEPVNGSIHEKPWRWWPVIVNDGKGHLLDVQLLMRRGEYRRVAALTPLLEKYPSPEFAQCVAAAHQFAGAEITGAVLGRSPKR